jgi:MFS family permease
MLGASNIWWVPLGNIFGRRPVMVVSTLMLMLCTMWCGLAKSFESLLAARFFQGCGGGPADTLAPDLIGEIFFVHQRGRALVSRFAIVYRGETMADEMYRLSILHFWR